MKRKNSFFDANRLKTILLFIIVNIILFALYQFSALEFYGTVETPRASWSSYTKFHNKNLESLVILVKKADDETQTKSLSYDYRLSKSKGGEYIVIGKSEPAPIRHNRVFYLDERCGLIFSNFAEMTVRNVALRCLY
ncbi:hypothetical protein BIY21_14780 [Vibrio ponticus]|uniref:Uncharacterized protein n=1 Tax=Vibrio ponticus TaxID=265668 RepID=A0ABX3FGQ3_9VIBR|nr:hypothetical protein BIY21_14780 [Vibrio ponticus]